MRESIKKKKIKNNQNVNKPWEFSQSIVSSHIQAYLKKSYGFFFFLNVQVYILVLKALQVCD